MEYKPTVDEDFILKITKCKSLDQIEDLLVLTFESKSEFEIIRNRLLRNPIYLEVHLKKEKKSGNTSYITRGDFIVLINSQHPEIQQQLSIALTKAAKFLEEGKKFALEIRLGTTLEAWYKIRFPEHAASYSAEGSNFCLTNYSQRMHICYDPIVWLVCLPCLLPCGPIYCLHRKLSCIDWQLCLSGIVKYVEGVSPEERLALGHLLAQAYVAGLNSTQAQNPVTEEPPPSYNQVQQI